MCKVRPQGDTQGDQGDIPKDGLAVSEGKLAPENGRAHEALWYEYHRCTLRVKLHLLDCEWR